MSAIFAFIHHIAAFTLFSSLVVEFVLLRDPPTLEAARKIQVADMVFGISAGIILAVGLMRVFFFEKGATYYFHNAAFVAKLSLFIIVGLASIAPTREFLSWRKLMSQGKSPNIESSRLQRLRWIVGWELAAVVGIILCAALMARGIGTFA